MQSPKEFLENLNKQAIKHKDDKEYKFNELYKQLLNPLMYKHAYAQIYANKGSGTAGIDGETVDGFGEETIQRIINVLKDETYQPKPTRRTYIDKKNNRGKRPLGIPAMTDRYIQEILNEMLTIIYEPTFSNKSYGFRQGLSCHDAIHAIQTTFQGTVWFIEGDIKGFFDNIDHHIMIGLLRKKINDERFIRLVWKFLKAGYLEEWTFHRTYSGTPQGGLISPILANIYLNEFDKYVEQMQVNFHKGSATIIPKTAEYTRLREKLKKIRTTIKGIKDAELQKGNVHVKNNKEHKELLKKFKITKLEQIATTRQQFAYKSRYKKICYVRYADDFILGVIGSEEEAKEIKKEIGEFLKNTLKLELSQDKTLITHSSDKAKFLSYEINIYQKGIIHLVKGQSGTKELRTNGKGMIKLTMSSDIVTKKMIELNVIEDINAEHWKARRNTLLINNSELEIIDSYNEQIRGIYNYFRLANNVAYEMNKFYYIMKWSMFHTFANKHKSTISKMTKKYRIGNTEEFGVTYYTKQGEQIRKFYHDGFKRNQYVAHKGSNNLEVDYIPNRYKFMGRNEMEKRLLADNVNFVEKKPSVRYTMYTQ